MSQNKSSKKVPSTLKEFLHIAAKPLIFLLFLIMVCSFLAHDLTSSETLEEYARANPDIAYGNAASTLTDETPGTAQKSSADGDISGTAQSSSADSNTFAGGSISNTPQHPTAGGSIPDTPQPPTVGGNISDTPWHSSATGNVSDAPDDSVPADSTAAESDPAVATGTSNTTSAYDTMKSTSGENNDMTESTDRTTYQTGFYYEPLSEEIKQRITGISYPETGCTVPYEDLNYVSLLYIDFNGEEQTGELICNKAIAQDMVEIFYELYRNQYQIERIRLIDEYEGDDTRSMEDNNTSCFNYRVVDGTTKLSKHALGCAIDINPFYNPYVVFNRPTAGETYISPRGSEIYADRSQSFPYKIDENDLCYKLFTEHGFTWGGNWNSSKDYQHFQITLP